LDVGNSTIHLQTVAIYETEETVSGHTTNLAQISFDGCVGFINESMSPPKLQIVLKQIPKSVVQMVDKILESPRLGRLLSPKDNA
jgi:hypothetical protein